LGKEGNTPRFEPSAFSLNQGFVFPVGRKPQQNPRPFAGGAIDIKREIGAVLPF
jgi:hypothetical protein